MSYILYGYWRSSATFRVRAAMELKGIPYQIVPVHLVRGGGEQHRPEYRVKNPLGEVPALALSEADDAPILAQSVAIMEFLEEKHPTPPLLPAGALERARVRQLVETVNSGIHPIQNLKVLQELTRRFDSDSAGNEAWARDWIARGFEGLEELCRAISGAHAFGDAVTLADCAIVPQVYNARRFGVAMERFPTILRIWEHAMALPAFQRAAPEAQPDAVVPRGVT